MDPFTNFQSFDTTSQYGGAIDDTQSVISGYTTSTQLKHLQPAESLVNGETNGQDHFLDKQRQDDDLDTALDDFKDNAVDLPPHACASASFDPLSVALLANRYILLWSIIGTAAFTILPRSSNVSCAGNGSAIREATPPHLILSTILFAQSTRRLSCMQRVHSAKRLLSVIRVAARTSSCWVSFPRRATRSSCSFAGESCVRLFTHAEYPT